jgi:hypothetical protein
MDKRLEKRHKRQVARAREKVKVSEPDLRTPEQIAAAKAAPRDRLHNTNPWPSMPGESANPAKPEESE